MSDYCPECGLPMYMEPASSDGDRDDGCRIIPACLACPKCEHVEEFCPVQDERI